MSPTTHQHHLRGTHTVARTGGGLAAAVLIIGLSAVPATAKPDPAPPSPDPWTCVDLRQPDALNGISAQRVSAESDVTVATAAVLGAISGAVLTGGGLGIAALAKRRSRGRRVDALPSGGGPLTA